MRDDGVRPTCNGQFEKEFVAWAREKWPQKEVNVGFAAEEAKSTYYGVDRIFRNVEALSFTLANGFVFENQRN